MKKRNTKPKWLKITDFEWDSLPEGMKVKFKKKGEKDVITESTNQSIEGRELRRALHSERVCETNS